MARIPKLKLTPVGAVGAARPVQNQQPTALTGAVNAGNQVAAATENLGAAFDQAANQFAQVGAAEQKLEVKRGTDAGVLAYDQRLFDIRYGTKDSPGYISDLGDSAINNAPAVRAAMDAARQELGQQFQNDPAQLADYMARTGASRLSSMSAHAGRVSEQRHNARLATNAAIIATVQRDMVASAGDTVSAFQKLGAGASPDDLAPHEKTALAFPQKMWRTLTDQMVAMGTPEKMQEGIIKATFDAAHGQAIQAMIDTGNSVEATQYLNQYESHMTTKGASTMRAKLRTAGVKAEAQAFVDHMLIAADEDGNLLYDTEAKRNAHARTAPKGDVRDAVRIVTGQINTQKVRERTDDLRAASQKLYEAIAEDKNPVLVLSEDERFLLDSESVVGGGTMFTRGMEAFSDRASGKIRVTGRVGFGLYADLFKGGHVPTELDIERIRRFVADKEYIPWVATARAADVAATERTRKAIAKETQAQKDYVTAVKFAQNQGLLATAQKQMVSAIASRSDLKKTKKTRELFDIIHGQVLNEMVAAVVESGEVKNFPGFTNPEYQRSFDTALERYERVRTFWDDASTERRNALMQTGVFGLTGIAELYETDAGVRDLVDTIIQDVPQFEEKARLFLAANGKEKFTQEELDATTLEVAIRTIQPMTNNFTFPTSMEVLLPFEVEEQAADKRAMEVRRAAKTATPPAPGTTAMARPTAAPAAPGTGARPTSDPEARQAITDFTEPPPTSDQEAAQAITDSTESTIKHTTNAAEAVKVAERLIDSGGMIGSAFRGDAPQIRAALDEAIASNLEAEIEGLNLARNINRRGQFIDAALEDQRDSLELAAIQASRLRGESLEQQEAAALAAVPTEAARRKAEVARKAGLEKRLQDIAVSNANVQAALDRFATETVGETVGAAVDAVSDFGDAVTDTITGDRARRIAAERAIPSDLERELVARIAAKTPPSEAVSNEPGVAAVPPADDWISRAKGLERERQAQALAERSTRNKEFAARVAKAKADTNVTQQLNTTVDEMFTAAQSAEGSIGKDKVATLRSDVEQLQEEVATHTERVEAFTELLAGVDEPDLSEVKSEGQDISAATEKLRRKTEDLAKAAMKTADDADMLTDTGATAGGAALPPESTDTTPPNIDAEIATSTVVRHPNVPTAIRPESDRIIEDEGRDRAHSYVDTVDVGDGTTRSVLTGGVGHALTPEEQRLYPDGTFIPQWQRDQWWDVDFQEAFDDASSLVTSPDVDPEAVRIITNMAMMGRTRLSGFRGLFKALNKSPPDYALAANEMEWFDPSLPLAQRVHTAWFNQTGRRADRLLERMRALGAR